MKYVSTCCGAEVHIYYFGSPTHFHGCKQCKKPCDTKQKEEPQVNERISICCGAKAYLKGRRVPLLRGELLYYHCMECEEECDTKQKEEAMGDDQKQRERTMKLEERVFNYYWNLSSAIEKLYARTPADLKPEEISALLFEYNRRLPEEEEK